VPYEIVREGEGYWVTKKEGGKHMHKSPHKTRAEALAHMRALYSAEDGGAAMAKNMRRGKK